MEKQAYGELSIWANDGIELAKKYNLSLEDIQKMLKAAWGLSTIFDIFWEK